MPKIQKVGRSGNSYLGAFFAFSAFVVIAIIALAINMGPTNLKQEAAISDCTVKGGTCFYTQCSTGYFPVYGTTSSTCNVNGNYQCCQKKLATPIGLKAYSWYCKFDGVEHDTINFNWNRINSADYYTLYYRLYGNDKNGDLYPTHKIKVSQDNSDKIIIKMINMKNNNGRRVQWWIKAFRNNYPNATSTSSKKTTPAAYESCG